MNAFILIFFDLLRISAKMTVECDQIIKCIYVLETFLKIHMSVSFYFVPGTFTIL